MTDNLLVAADMVVSFNYTLRSKDNQVIDASEGTPLSYLHGHDNIVKGLERELTGLSVGSKKSVVVSPEEGYGVINPDMFIPVQRSQLPEGARSEVGEVFELSNEHGHRLMARVTRVEGDVITLDANHPLAGQPLHFDVEITEVRPATKDELAHGHAHGVGGHHH